MITILVALLLIGFFFVFEGRLRQGSAAKSMERSETDRGSTILVGLSFGIASLIFLATAYAGSFLFCEVVDFRSLRDFGSLNYLSNPAGLSCGSTSFIYGSLVAWIGIALMVAGIGMRFWANRTLGKFYTRTLLTTANQYVVQAGPYRIVRHPGYLGTIMLWIGAGIATANWTAAALIAILMVSVYSYRIRSEEAMLQSALGDEYKKYMTRTWRLIPLVY